MIIGKTFKFEAAHCLPGHEKCGKVHGHTYKLTVEVRGDIDKKTGIVLDLHDLSDIVASVIRNFDHANLNEYFTDPTCENIVQAIANGIIGELVMRNLDYIDLHSVQLQEGEGGYARKER